MKTVIIACGAGVATSTILTSKVKMLADQEGIAVELIQCSLNEVNQYLDKADLVVSSMQIHEALPIPKVLGISFLSGINEEATKEQILKILKENR